MVDDGNAPAPLIPRTWDPGEAVELQVYLYNAGSSQALSISGTLIYTGGDGWVTIDDNFASWPTLPIGSAPVASQSPHFALRLSSSTPCNASLPFLLHLTTPNAQFDRSFSLRAGVFRREFGEHIQTIRDGRQDASFYGADGSAGNDEDRLSSVATGDFNGDGFEDAAMGAPGGDSLNNSRYQSGEVYVAYGKSGRWTDTDTAAAPPSGFIRIWGTEHELIGSRLTSGDVNGDGYDDLLINAADSVWLVYGKGTQWTDTDLASPPSGVAKLYGWSYPPSRSIAAGDFNGDGFDDLLFGMPERLLDPGDPKDRAGEVRLLYGQSAQFPDTNIMDVASGTIKILGGVPFDNLNHSSGFSNITQPA